MGAVEPGTSERRELLRFFAAAPAVNGSLTFLLVTISGD